MGLSTVKDIKYRGKNVNKVVYRGQVIWEREPDTPPLTISDMTYMQDLALPENASACTNTPDRTRTTLKDRRNNQDYYIEKIGNLCWMESNLRYEGGGNNTYGDTKTLTLRSSGASTNTVAEYANLGGSTDYTNTTANGGFYGYGYNWCAAMGGQANACNTTSTSGFNTTISICPAGWRLPTGNGGEFQAMTNAIGATNNAAGSTNLRNNVLAVYSGRYGNSSLNYQGTDGYWWSSTVRNATYAYSLYFVVSNVLPVYDSNKNYSFAVRCVAD